MKVKFWLRSFEHLKVRIYGVLSTKQKQNSLKKVRYTPLKNNFKFATDLYSYNNFSFINVIWQSKSYRFIVLFKIELKGNTIIAPCT